MQDLTTESFTLPTVTPAVHDPLTDVLRQGARQMLIKAVEAEAAAWIDEHIQLTDKQGNKGGNKGGQATLFGGTKGKNKGLGVPCRNPAYSRLDHDVVN